MKKQSANPKKKPIIAISVGLVILAFILLSILIPLSMTDGLEKYSGTERAVGSSNLAEFGYPNRGIDMVSHLGELKYRVEVVEPIDPIKVGCKKSSETGQDYLTVISRRTFFGIQDQVIVVTPCEYKVGSSVKTLYPDIDL